MLRISRERDCCDPSLVTYRLHLVNSCVLKYSNLDPLPKTECFRQGNVTEAYKVNFHSQMYFSKIK